MASDVISTGASTIRFPVLVREAWTKSTPVLRENPGPSAAEEALCAALYPSRGRLDEVVFDYIGSSLVRRRKVTVFHEHGRALEIMDPVDILDRISSQTGLSRDEVLKAAGISRRTFYSWQRSGSSRPRKGSLGRLWELVATIEDLQEIIERPLKLWLGSDPDRGRLLCRGRFEEILDIAVRVPVLRVRGTRHAGEDLEMLPIARSSAQVVAMDDRS